MNTETRNQVLSLIHDLNSPLCALRSLLQDSERNQELELKAYFRFNELSKKLRSHYQIENYESTSSLLDTIEDVVDLKEMEYPKVVFSIQCNPLLRDLAFVFCSTELERVVSNIINNAVEAGASQICIKITNQKGKIMIRVVDNGNGFFAHDISSVQRRPGHTTKPNGSGIGLSSCKAFLKSVGGDLKILSTPYVGSNIILSFPQEIFESLDFGPTLR